MAFRTVLALAAGGGGLERAIHRAIPGARVVCYVEHEVTAASVLASEMARGRLDEAPVWSDVHTFDPEPWRGLVDIVAAGYPCQPFSVAGKQRGNDDPRHIWPSIARIIRSVEPGLCIFENVANHLRLGGHEVIRELQGMGYTTAGTLWRAEEVGAPHRRERFFILGSVPDTSAGGRGAVLTDLCAGQQDSARSGMAHTPDLGHERAGVARRRWERPADGSGAVGDADEQRPQGRGEPEREGAYERPPWPPGPQDDAGWRAVLAERPDLAPAVEPPVRGMADGLAGGGLGRADRLRILGNGVVPPQAEAAIREMLEALCNQ